MNLRKCLIKPCDLETLASDRVVWNATCEAGLAHFVSDWIAASEERRTTRHTAATKPKLSDMSTVSSLRQNLCLPVWSAESPAYTSTPAQHNSIVVQRHRRRRRTSAAAAWLNCTHRVVDVTDASRIMLCPVARVVLLTLTVVDILVQLQLRPVYRSLTTEGVRTLLIFFAIQKLNIVVRCFRRPRSETTVNTERHHTEM